MADSKYYVWKRNDGYIASSCHMPQGWKTPHGEVTFEHLGTFDKWDNATIEFILNARKTLEAANVSKF